jgi:hypothetical protein
VRGKFGAKFLVYPYLLFTIFPDYTNRFTVLTLFYPVAFKPETLAASLDGA